MLKTIRHKNWIETEINYSQFLPSSSRQVYCRKLHKITEPQLNDCSSCSCYHGVMMGKGHECIWEDVVPDDLNDTENGTFTNRNTDREAREIEWKQRTAELLRVSQLIDQGILKKSGELQ